MATKKTTKKKKVGAKKKTFSVKAIIEAINTDKANPYTNSIARVFKVDFNTMRNFINEHPEIQEAMDLRKTSIVELAEDSINSILMNKEHPEHAKTAKWVLSVRNNDYKEKQDIKLDGGIEINIKGLENL